ncbi:cupin domain-containing protein [Sphingomonas sp. GlSt437]
MIALALLLETAALPTRTPIATLPIAPAKTVDRVETTRVDFAPAQAMPAHYHTVPVVCFVAQGSFEVSIGDAPVRIVSEGETTLEPAGTVVHYFRNRSTTAPARLLCASLAGHDDHQLNVMLDPAHR